MAYTLHHRSATGPKVVSLPDGLADQCHGRSGILVHHRVDQTGHQGLWDGPEHDFHVVFGNGGLPKRHGLIE